MPYEVKSDNGAAFRQTWEEETDKLGVRVLHSRAYNSQSMGLVEGSVCSTHPQRDVKEKQQPWSTTALRTHLRRQL